MGIKVLSTGEIAKLINQPTYRVDHIVRSRRIEPTINAGGRHFYSEGDVQLVKEELDLIDRIKQSRKKSHSK